MPGLRNVDGRETSSSFQSVRGVPRRRLSGRSACFWAREPGGGRFRRVLDRLSARLFRVPVAEVGGSELLLGKEEGFSWTCLSKSTGENGGKE